jgi:hypothetical protein
VILLIVFQGCYFLMNQGLSAYFVLSAIQKEEDLVQAIASLGQMNVTVEELKVSPSLIFQVQLV